MATREPNDRRRAAGENDWLTLGQAAKFLGVAQSTTRKWSDGGRVPAFYTPGGHRRFKRGDLEAFLERSGPGKPARGPLVLLVDDDAQVREVVRINLEMEGYAVREAANAEDGLAALEDEAPDLISLDGHLERWVVHHRAGWLNPVFEGLSYVGRLGLVWIVIALVLSAVYRRWGAFVLMLIAIALADWSSMGLKSLIDRPRPPLRYPEPKTLVPLPHDASFPSGHASTSFAAATMLSLSFPRFAPFLYVLAAAIAFSRVYVGVHYPLDVVGGAGLGVLVAVVLRLLVQRRAQRRLNGVSTRSTKA